jgi:hypothetical protein
MLVIRRLPAIARGVVGDLLHVVVGSSGSSGGAARRGVYFMTSKNDGA